MMRPRLKLSRPAVLLPALVALALPGTAEAKKPRIKRKGGQAEGLFGVSACIPGPGECQSEAPVEGTTAPLIGMGANLGWRANRFLFIGGGYNVGWFNPNHTRAGNTVYSQSLQHSFFGVLRGYLPVWRVDFGLELSPGWSRQLFYPQDKDEATTFSQGFALRPGLSVDFWITRQFFLGAKVDTIFNFHHQICSRNDGSMQCDSQSSNTQARVHQLIGGLHLGGTF